MTAELRAMQDAAIARLEEWNGQRIDVQESLHWPPDEVGHSPRGPVGYFQFPLLLGLNMSTGALTLAHGSAGTDAVLVDYGVLLHRLTSVEFPDTDRIVFVEQLGTQVMRRTIVRRLGEG